MSGATYEAALARVDWIQPDPNRLLPVNPALHEPGVVRMANDEIAWLVKTDGRTLLAVLLAPGEAEKGRTHSAHQYIGSLLTETEGPARSVDVARLRALLPFQAAENPACKECGDQGVKCERCDGEGELDCECSCGHEHTRDCPICDGAGQMKCPHCGRTGKHYPPIRTAEVSGLEQTAYFDAQLLDRLLSHLDGIVTWRQQGPENPVHVTGDGWIALLMPLRSSVSGKAEFQINLADAESAAAGQVP